MAMNKKAHGRAWHKDTYDENDEIFNPKFEEDLLVRTVSNNIQRLPFAGGGGNHNNNDDVSSNENDSNTRQRRSSSISLSDSAIKRREKLIKLQQQSKKEFEEKIKKIASASTSKNKNALKAMKKSIGKVGKTINKFNPGKWIDDLEKDQILADDLEQLNKEMLEEQERKAIMKEAEEACLNAIKEHLMEFIDENPNGKYEEWIAELHPENIKVDEDGIPLHLSSEDDNGGNPTPIIDHRFYVQESDHRKLWNMNLGMYEDCDVDNYNSETINNPSVMYARSFVEAKHLSDGTNLQ